MKDYPAKPETNLFQRDYGYSPVKEILKWEWSVTFNQWGALVVFPRWKKGFHLAEKNNLL